MIIGVLEISLHIPGSSSLKDKRKVIKGLKEKIRNQFNVSLAEIDGQNTWQSCHLACSMVALQKLAIEKEFQHIIALIDRVSELDIQDHWIDYL
jgi:uncharacterized protein YlxP (DUF503 family)